MQATQPETTRRTGRIGRWIFATAVFVLVCGVVGWAAIGRFGTSGPESDSGPLRSVTSSQEASEPTTSDLPGAGSADAGRTGELEPAASPGVTSDVVVPEETVAQVVVQGDKVVRTANLTITVDDGIDAALTTTRGVVDGVGGFVASLDRSTTDDSATASVTVRVPAGQFESAVDRLEDLGEVTASTQTTQDVTQQSIDIDARLRTLAAEADALRGLLSRAASTTEILEIRRQLNDITTQIEVLQAQRQALDQQIAMSTISLFLSTPGAVVGPEPTGYWSDALGEAWDRLRDGLAAIFVGAATLIPFALLAVVLFYAGRAGWRRWQHRDGPTTEVEPTASA